MRTETKIKMIPSFLMMVLAFNFSCHEQEVKPGSDFIKTSQAEISQLAATYDLSSLEDRQTLVPGIISILKKNGGTEITDQALIGKLNAAFDSYRSEEIDNAGNKMQKCEMKCENSSSMAAGNGMYVIVAECFDGCGNGCIMNGWFKGTKIVAFNQMCTWD